MNVGVAIGMVLLQQLFPFCKMVKPKGKRIHVKLWDTSFLHNKYGP